MGKKRARTAQESFAYGCARRLRLESFANGCARKLALVRFEIISG